MRAGEWEKEEEGKEDTEKRNTRQEQNFKVGKYQVSVGAGQKRVPSYIAGRSVSRHHNWSVVNKIKMSILGNAQQETTVNNTLLHTRKLLRVDLESSHKK